MRITLKRSGLVDFLVYKFDDPVTWVTILKQLYFTTIFLLLDSSHVYDFGINGLKFGFPFFEYIAGFHCLLLNLTTINPSFGCLIFFTLYVYKTTFIRM